MESVWLLNVLLIQSHYFGMVSSADGTYELLLTNKPGSYFGQTSEALLTNEGNPTANTYSIIGTFTETKRNRYKTLDGKYQFKLVYGYNDGSQDILEWKQQSWLTDEVIVGADLFGVPTQTVTAGNAAYFSGLGLNKKHSQYSLLDGDASANNGAYIWNSVGEITPYSNGIPAFNSKIAQTSTLFIYRSSAYDSYELLLINAPGSYFGSTAEALLTNEGNPNANTYSIISTFTEPKRNKYKTSDGKYQFKLVYGYSDGSQDILEWKQQNWLTDEVIIGADLFGVPTQTVTAGNAAYFNGLGLNKKHSQYSLLDGDASANNGDYIWNSVGEITPYSNGIPAFNSKIAQTSALYIYNYYTSSIFEDGPDEICRPAFAREWGKNPAYCPDGYPDFDGVLCYQNCPAGYDGVSTACYEQCNSNEIDDGLFCRIDLKTEAKHTYGRGVGVSPNSCSSGKYNDGGLCYYHCAAGYSPALHLCWENCAAGYEDHGLTCFSWLHGTYGKRSYDRGVGTTPNVCPPGKPDLNAGFCYPLCQSGYYGVGPVCWKYCPSGSIDKGTLCEIQSLNIRTKKIINRGVGHLKSKCEPGYVNEAGLCYQPCQPDDKWDGFGPVCWNKQFGKSLGVIAVGTILIGKSMLYCSGILAQLIAALVVISIVTIGKLNLTPVTACLWLALSAMSVIDPEWNPNTVTVAFELSGSAAVGVGKKGFLGLAFNFPMSKPVEIYGYTGDCDFITNDIGVSVEIAMVLYRGISDVAGKSSYFSVGVDIPGTDIGAGISYAFGADCAVIAFSVSASVGVSQLSPDVSIAGGVCVSSETELLGTISRRRLEAENGNGISGISSINNNNNNKLSKIETKSVNKCFQKLSSKYYPRCNFVMTLNKMEMKEYQTTCYGISQCIGYVYNVKINRAQILTLTECPINNIEWFDDNDNEEFYINTCIEDNINRFCNDNGFCELSKELGPHNIANGKLINQYYAKCPFDIKVKVNNLISNDSGNDNIWYNIFTFDANGDIPYPGLFVNYATNQYKLQVGNGYECISRLISRSMDMNILRFKISIECNGKASLYLNNKLLCNTDKYDIFDIESSEGQIVTVFGSDASYKTANGNILSIKATKPIYPWNGYINHNGNDDVIFKTLKERQYLLHENTLTAPFLKFEGNYLIKTDIYLNLDKNQWTEKQYNIFEIGFDDDLDITTNDIILNYVDDKTFGLMLGISTSDETVRFCFENNKNFNKNDWNTIKVFIESRKATLIVNNIETCFIDLTQTPINTHQQMVPLIFASTRLNSIQGLFKNVIIRNNVNFVSKSIYNSPQTPETPVPNVYRIDLFSYKWGIIVVLLSGNIIFIYLTCFYKNKNKHGDYGAVKYLSETEEEESVTINAGQHI